MSKEELKEKLIQFAKQYYDDISHPLAVANQFEELSPEWVVGLFHDILEDTNCKGLISLYVGFRI
jgi:(p)ppGpp synthase/HD superfamily hydrolase